MPSLTKQYPVKEIKQEQEKRLALNVFFSQNKCKTCISQNKLQTNFNLH